MACLVAIVASDACLVAFVACDVCMVALLCYCHVLVLTSYIIVHHISFMDLTPILLELVQVSA